MEALFQEQFFPSPDAFIFRHPSTNIPVDPRKDVVQNGSTIFKGPSFDEDYPHVHSNHVVGEGNSSPQVEGEGEGEHYDAMYKYISQMLMEEDDLENKPCMLRDCMALQAAEKYFSDVLHGSENNKSPQSVIFNPQDSSRLLSNTSSDSIESPQWNLNFESPVSVESLSGVFNPDSVFNNHSFGNDQVEEEVANVFQSSSSSDDSPTGSREKKNHHRGFDDDGADQQRSNKQLAAFTHDESEPLEMYDKVLLVCPTNPYLEQHNGTSVTSCSPNEPKKATKVGRPRGGRKNGSSISKKEMVDLRGLLTQCAQAMASYDSRTASEKLIQIREHSSPHGDGTERLAHYLANALEARLSGTGTALYTTFASSRISAAHILKAYKAYITACPFKLMSNIFANKRIRKLIFSGGPKIHIIDFGILYGFQWPCLIQGLSMRPGGPPELRITGIELPQPGFKPAERVEDTGRRLEKYCKRFNVPFVFKAIAKKWETITLEELEIQRDEVLVVNSLFRLGNIPDETVVPNSPRDAVLNLIRKIRPDIFIHGVVNGTFNTPFFVTRFREALFHFSSLFDMFEATLPREDEDRKLFEEEVFARDAMNVIACEGTERVERPETYKQWQLRCVRAGFKQVPLDQEIMKIVRTKVRSEYHKDFSVDEDGHWMLQGWKGRVIYALSCWKPTRRSL
ncbi:scarecrow-like protein 30 [Lycium barbarum]|uniref:scarecrow-like protein 30 n=1 Tax=Lycium barbarum TaxID=112863 RepID=UPI00293F5F89|nr:scarecrow-like protein 30 [Lycium barbarum]